MRGVKLTVAIITIILGSIATLAGVGLTFMGLMWGAIGAQLAGTELEAIFGAFGSAIGAMILFGGLIVLAISIILIVLGSKFCSRKPNKGIAITLIVIYGLETLSLLGGNPAGILGAAMLALCIVYLVLLGKQNKQQVAPQPQVESSTGQESFQA